jgi:1-aminocyclopropane-1-carboxylate deaminase/D-cysteine desulfhydrase-like pyridoxal-dependent ACC family enzyme
MRPAPPPRFPFAVLPTPLHRAHRLEAALRCGPLLLKRDDLVGFGAAGNKARPLEHLIGDARARGAEVLVTGGGPGSNFCAAAALAAAVAGMECELVVWGDDRDETRGNAVRATSGDVSRRSSPSDAPNLALAAAAGARLIPTGGTDRGEVDRLVEARAAELGPRAYPVSRGGSTPVGAAGFAAAAAELDAQLAALGVEPALVVLALGSGGSTGGLLAGLAAAGRATPVLAVSVSRPPGEITARVLELAAACAALLGGPAPAPDRLEVLDARGAGFGTASDRERERARLALLTEGLLLDGTYGAQAFSATVDRLPGASGPVVYWHTGGLVPALRSLTEGCP